ncbi:lariat debranching enzyme [Collariella sp. IMI 366227]|nr:lariat debranching enzyme [Collariella sp. IMI 366227]
MASSGTVESGGVRIAVEGCGHGTLNAIYAAVDRSCKERNWDGVDLLIIGGDFQAVRNAADLNAMSVPPKYRQLGDFPDYYSGKRNAPYLTIFVAGNHEAASHLWELYYGGWVAPNIYYMGAANVLRLGPIRIAGMSGIWKGFDYKKPHHERLPFNSDDVKSFYHVREIDVRKLLQLRTQVDIGISHDWPRAIEKHGNQKRLLRPQYWFSAHLHCKFAAIKKFEPLSQGESTGEAAQPAPEPVLEAAPAANPDEIDLGFEDDYEAPVPAATPTQPAEHTTQETTTTETLRSQLPASFARPISTPAPSPANPSLPESPTPPPASSPSTSASPAANSSNSWKSPPFPKTPPRPLTLSYDPDEDLS